MDVLQELQRSVERVLERVGPAVVGIGHGWGLGSGVVVAEGQVLTNAHNVRDEGVTVTLGDGTSTAGRVVGLDPEGDLAAVAVETTGVEPVEWDPAAATPRLGTPIFALANPGGRGLRVTLGFVSATGQRLRGPRGRLITGILEHTAPLPRGSSGGPVVDGSGRLLGLNTVRLDGGLILALGADASLKDRADGLWRGEASARPRLGVALAPAHVARRLRRAVGLPERDGLLVQEVEEGGPAERAEIRKGDLIVSAADRPIVTPDDLFAALDEPAGRKELPLSVVRGTEERQLVVALGEAASAATSTPRRRARRCGR